MKNLRFAIIGCGRIGERHAKLLGSKLINNASLVAVCDVNEEKSKNFGELYDVPYFTDLHKMMENQEINVVSVLTPSGLHAKHVIELSKYACDIVVEKPMALKYLDAKKMIQKCSENKSRLFVVKQNRFNKPILKLREAIDKNFFGKIVLATIRVRWARDQEYYNQNEWRGTWKYDGGVISNQASHHVDMLDWMVGDVESLNAKINKSLVNIEAEDTAICNLKFKSGALGVIEATNCARPKNLEGSISILGENGAVVVSGMSMNKLETWTFSDERLNLEMNDLYNENPPDVYGYGHKMYYDHVVDCILNNKNSFLSGEHGSRSVKLINAIYESAVNLREVYLDDLNYDIKLGN